VNAIHQLGAIMHRFKVKKPSCSNKSMRCEDGTEQGLIIADNLSKAGWSLGWVSAVDSRGGTTWIVDAHCDYGKRFIVGQMIS
jgi:hypothetical protein